MAEDRRDAANEEHARRLDDWRNLMSGLGTSRDRRTQVDFGCNRMAEHPGYQESLWEGDDMVARIIETEPAEMMRKGWELEIDSGAQDTSEGTYDAAEPYLPKQPGPSEGDKETAEAIKQRFEELHGDERVHRALEYARAFGGGAILVGADDGETDLTKPLNLDDIRSLKWLNVLGPRELHAAWYYADPGAPRYGEPEIYRISPDMITGRSGDVSKLSNAEIHESRIIPFDGISVTPRARLRHWGWGQSVLVRCLQVVVDFQAAYGSAAHLVTDFAQAVYKVPGLLDIIAQGNATFLKNKVEAIDMARSAIRAAVIDSTEEFERKTTPLSGLPELLDKFANRLAAAADMPVTLLMGQSPAGLNATGDSDIRFFYDRIAAKQQKKLKPALARLLRLIMLSKDGPTKGVEPEHWSIEFCPLWQETEAEKETRLKTRSDRDLNYVNMGAVEPEEVAALLSAENLYPIDLEARQKMKAAEAKQPVPVQPPAQPAAPVPPSNGAAPQA